VAEAITFHRYYKRVMARAWQDMRHNVKGAIVAIVAAVAVTFLRVHWGLLTPRQQWLTVVANVLPVIVILGGFCLFYILKAPVEIHNEDQVAHAEHFAAAIKASETRLAEIRQELDVTRKQYEEANTQLTLRLIDPILHFEPENGTVQNTGKPCCFVISLVNTGLVDVERLQIFVTYFIAQKISGSVVLKAVGHGAYIPALKVAELKSKGSLPIGLDFSTELPIMKEVGINGGRDVPYIFGVKLHAKFRRRADGKDFDVLGCYGSDVVTGHGLYTPDPFSIGMPEELKNILTLNEAVKYINSPDHWVSVVTEISANSRKYR
jgi:hypothetical protein